MLALLLSLALAADRPDETVAATSDDGPPLELVSPKSTAATTWSTGGGLFLGAHVGGFFGSGPAGVAASVEVGLALPPLQRALALSLQPSFVWGTRSRNTVAGAMAQTHLGFVMPLLASFNRDVGPGLLRVIAGPSLVLLDGKSRVSTAGGRVGTGFDAFQVGLGVDAGLAYLLWFTRVGIGLDVRYRATPFAEVNQSQLSHAVLAQVSGVLPL